MLSLDLWLIAGTCSWCISKFGSRWWMQHESCFCRWCACLSHNSSELQGWRSARAGGIMSWKNVKEWKLFSSSTTNLLDPSFLIRKSSILLEYLEKRHAPCSFPFSCLLYLIQSVLSSGDAAIFHNFSC